MIFTIFCVVEGQSTWNAFPVKIDDGDYISTLRNLIKAAQSPAFDHIPADELSLWKTDHYVYNLLDQEKVFHVNAQPEATKLHPLMRINTVLEHVGYPTPNIQVLVELPKHPMAPKAQ
jgi:hypothetical protein